MSKPLIEGPCNLKSFRLPKTNERRPPLLAPRLTPPPPPCLEPETKIRLYMTVCTGCLHRAAKKDGCPALFPTDPSVVRGENSGNQGGALSVIHISKHRARSKMHLLHGYLAHTKAPPPYRGISLVRNTPPYDPTVALFLGTYPRGSGYF